MNAFTCSAVVVDGKVELARSSREQMNRWASSMGDGLVLTIKVSEYKPKRSLDQNAYWWAEPVTRIAAELGYTKNQMHYVLLGEYGGYVEGPRGQVVPKVASSSELNKQQFSDLITWVLDWAPRELGIVVKTPEQWMAQPEDEVTYAVPA